MTLDELRTELATVPQGKYAGSRTKYMLKCFHPESRTRMLEAAAYAFAKSLGFRKSRTSLTTNRYGSSKRHNLSIPAVRNRGPFPPSIERRVALN